MRKIFLARTSAVGLCGALLLASLSLPAWANGDPAPEESISKVVNEALLEATGESLDGAPNFDLVGTELQHESEDFSLSFDLADSANKFEVLMESSESEKPEGEAQEVMLSIEVPGLEGAATSLDEQLVGSVDPGDDSETVVQPHAQGLRIMEIIHEPTAPRDYLTNFSSGREIDPVFLEDGTIFLHDIDGEYLGHLDPPWALDSDGRPVPTSYSWKDGTLIQHVEHQSGDYKYPIVSDPTWTYSFNGSPSIAGYGVTWRMADSELRRCFNCSFPISGAPVWYPRTGEIIRLNASPMSLINVAAPVKVNGASPGFFSFIAQRGHFDDEGSRIGFVFYQTCSKGVPTLRLSVTATILRDRGSFANSANSAIARGQWQNFLDRTYKNTWNRQGRGGRC